MQKSSLTIKERYYLRRYARIINRHCCTSKDKRIRLYHIGYIGNRLCKVVVCADCEKMQVLCGRLGRFLLKRYFRKGITRINIIVSLKTEDLFLYGK
nr:MAG TPA: hypothetical protein [Caudoviricetes sp.]